MHCNGKAWSPAVSTYNALLSACEKGMQPDLRTAGPTSTAYNALFSACEKGTQPDLKRGPRRRVRATGGDLDDECERAQKA